MKITKAPSGKTKIIALVVVLAVVAAGYALSNIWQNNASNQTPDKLDDGTGLIQPGQAGENNEGTNLPKKPPYNNSVEPSKDDGNKADSPSNVTPEKPQVTRAEQSGSNIKVTAIFTKPSSGSCELQLTKSGQPTINKKVQIITGPSYYACGFSVPSANMSKGKWSAVVVHQIGSARTASTIKVVEVY